MSLYTQLRSTAARLVEKYGQAVTLGRTIPKRVTSTPYTPPDFISASISANGVESAFNKSEIDGQNILASDRLLYITNEADTVTAWESDLTVQSGAFKSMATDGTTLIAIAQDGTAIKSTDGTTWAAVSGLDRDLEQIAYGNGVWAVSGNDRGNGVVWTSSNDGSTWVKQTFTSTDTFSGIVHITGNKWATFGVNGDYAYTTDSWATWTESSSVLGFSYLATDGAVVVAVGSGDVGAVSADFGATWTPIDLEVNNTWTGAGFFNGAFYVWTSSPGAGSASMVKSTDGTTWAEVSPGVNPQGFAFVTDRFLAIAAGGTGAYSTDNGATWTTISGLSSATWADMVAYRGGFVAVATDASEVLNYIDFVPPPAPGDTVTLGGETLRIINAEQINPGGTNLLTVCQARKA